MNSLADAEVHLYCNVPPLTRVPDGDYFCPSLDIAALDLIVVPGLAFSMKHLTRLGRGGGYYDRLLAPSQCRARRIALAHDFQILDELPVEAHDQRVHEILTASL